MTNKVPLNAQIESLVVAFVKVFNAGDNKYSVNSGMRGVTLVDPPETLDQMLRRVPRAVQVQRRKAGSREPRWSRMKIEMKMKVDARCWVTGRV